MLIHVHDVVDYISFLCFFLLTCFRASLQEENLSADLSRIRSKYRSAEAGTASNSGSSTSAAGGCEPTTRLAVLAPRLLFEWDASLHSERPERLLRLLATDCCIVVLSEAADDPRSNMLHTFVHDCADL